MAVTYDNIYFDYILDPLRDLFITEFSYGKIYISPSMAHSDPFSIRIWSGTAETTEHLVDAWQKQYNIIISLYSIEKNPGEEFYKQFYNDIERVYQLLFTNCTNKSTTIGATTHKWIDGICEDLEINEYDDQEAEVEGLNVCRFNFSCKLTRVS